MKFAHIADTHIRNLKYHKEYREVFNQLYTKLKKEKVDFIIHCGDIAHTKTQISPEFVDMCTNFFKNLSAIAPTYIILGNHDGNLRNSTRQDALSPIVSALNNKNLFLLKNSGEVELNDQFTINVLSVFDRENWQSPSDRNRINIALYHGAVSGVKTDTGWTMVKMISISLIILTMVFLEIFTKPINPLTKREEYDIAVQQYNKTMEKQTTRVFYYGTF